MALEVGAAPASALVIMAHPDDLEFMLGGTVARWIGAQAQVHLLLATRGEGGNQNHPDWSADRVILERAKEQQRSAQLLGLAGLTFLAEPDGETLPSLALRRRMVQEIRRLQPEVVVLPDPTCYYHGSHINHPDHRAVGEAALAAVFPLAGNPMYTPELGSFHKLREVWVALSGQPNAWVDIGPFLAKKLEAIRCHTSQVAHMGDLEGKIRAWNEHRQEDGRLSYREWFLRLPQG